MRYHHASIPISPGAFAQGEGQRCRWRRARGEILMWEAERGSAMARTYSMTPAEAPSAPASIFWLASPVQNTNAEPMVVASPAPVTNRNAICTLPSATFGCVRGPGFQRGGVCWSGVYVYGWKTALCG